MKKLFLIVCIILATFGFAGCSCTKSQISYEKEYVSIYENEEYEIDESKVVITGKGNAFEAFSLDENIAKVEGNKVLPQSVGKTFIRFKLNTKKLVYFDMEFEVKKGKLAKNVSVSKSRVDIDMSVSEFAYNVVTTNADCDEIPIITYDEDVISFDYATGKITGLAMGSTRVLIRYRDCQVAFDVYVKQKIYFQMMSIADCQVFANSKGTIQFVGIPSNANAYTFQLSEEDKDRTDFIIYSDGSFKSYGATTINLTCRYYTAENVSDVINFKVSVIEKLQEFEVTIQDEKGAFVSNFLANTKYKLTLKILKEIENANIVISGSARAISEATFVPTSGYEIDIMFDGVGTSQMIVTLIKTLGTSESRVSKTIDTNVIDNNSVTVGVKWSANELYKVDDKYVIYLDGKSGNLPDRLSIMIKINGEFDTTIDYQVFQIVDDYKVQMDTSQEFVPTATGEYQFEVYFEGALIEKITVLVKD